MSPTRTTLKSLLARARAHHAKHLAELDEIDAGQRAAIAESVSTTHDAELIALVVATGGFGKRR